MIITAETTQRHSVSSRKKFISETPSTRPPIVDCQVELEAPLGGSQSLVGIVLNWTSLVVWPLMLALPLALTSPYSPISYRDIFPAHWYEYNGTPKPLGLLLGILAVGIGQFFTCSFFLCYKRGFFTLLTEPPSIQTKGAREYQIWEGLATHLSQPEGFGMLVSYLSLTWMFNLMPQSYYSFEGGINYTQVFLCLAIQDCLQYTMHLLEHIVSPYFYQLSHKPHHRFINPRMFDAFNGSLLDTVCMITVPLFITAQCMRSCNVWTYMAFGSVFACWLTLIHSEYVFCWDRLFRLIGLGTPADHHVHHKLFKFNYGHLFMWWDQLFGTYRDPQQFAPNIFRPGV